MTRRGRTLKTLWLSLLAAFSLLAFGATAQAAQYTIGGKTLPEIELEEEEEEEEEAEAEKVTGTGGSLDVTLTVTGVITLEIDCKSATTDEWTIYFKGLSSGQILFSKCTIVINNWKGCLVDDVMTSVVSNKLIVHNGKIYNVLAPISGTELLFFSIGGEECPVGGKRVIRGGLVLSTEAEEKVEQFLTFSPELQALLSVPLNYGTWLTVVAGNLTLALSGINVGEKWGVIE